MTRSKSANSYPTQYLELAGRLNENPDEVVELEFETEAQARTFRLDFYSFRANAVREKLTDMYPELAAVTLSVHGNKVVVGHKDYTPIARAVMNALKKKDGK